MTPVRGSAEPLYEGKTNFHAHSYAARGYFACSAAGSSTSPNPTKAGAVEQTRHQPSVPCETRKQALRLRGGEHRGNTGRFAHSLQALEPGKRQGQNLFIEEKQRRQGLVLGRGGHPAIPGQMVEKRRDLDRPQIPRVSLSMEVDEAPDPVKIGFLRAQAVVQAANRLPNLLQQARLRRGPPNIVHTVSPRKVGLRFGLQLH